MALTISEAINPIKVTGTVATKQAVSTYKGRIRKIVWYAATTNAHKLDVGNGEGTSIWKAQMATTNLTENIEVDFGEHGLMVSGLSISDMDSGEVYIYTADSLGNV